MTKKKCKKGGCKVQMSVPKGMQFGVSYTMDHTLHSKYYYENDRNKSNIDDQFYNSFEEVLDRTCKDITNLLKEKNKAYGDSALNPANIFSKTNATESLCARIDDKIMRIKNKGINDQTEDTIDDLIGYLLLLKISINEK